MPENALRVMPEVPWTWNAQVVNVVDGDTIDVLIDCGFHATRTERVRLLGINCPETKEAAGKVATKFTADWTHEAGYDWHVNANNKGFWALVVQTHKSDAFGRYLAYVWRTSDGRCLNDDLLDSGNAVPFRG